MTQVDAYPMPRIDDILDQVGQARYITTLDLAKGYWQVPVAEEDHPKTAFITPRGLYQFKMMLFGLCGAPATFQRMMEVIRGMHKFASAYLDDLNIFSTTWEDHLTHLRAVLSRLQELRLTTKPSKCQFAMTECTYLGHVLGNGVVKPEEGKLRTIEQFPQPNLLGNEFTIQTDHRALQWLTKFKDSNNRLLRWSLALQPFRFQVVHLKGRDNANADSLSRQAEWQNNLRPEKGEGV